MFTNLNFKSSYALRWLVILSVGFAFLSSCAKENEPYHKIPDIRLKGSTCLTTAVANFKLYLESKSTVDQAAQIWPCFTYALKTFKKYVRGNNQDFYSPSEVRQFIENYFLNDMTPSRGKHIISDQLLIEMMGVKTLFVGGSRYKLTPQEIELAFQLIDKLNTATMDLLPYTDILFANINTRPEIDRFETAMLKLETALKSVFSLVKPQTDEYKFEDLQNLLTEVNYFLADIDKDNPKDFDWAKYIPSLARAKGILLNSSNQSIEGKEWLSLTHIVSQAFKIGLNFHYYLDGMFLQDKAKFARFQDFIDQASLVVNEAFSRRGGKPVANGEVALLLTELGKIKLLPFDLEGDGAVKTWNILTEEVLNPQRRFKDSGLSVEKFNYFITELGSWARIQNLLFDKKQDLLDPRWNEMQDVLSGPITMSLDDKSRIVLDGSKIETNLVAASRLNWSRVVFSALFRAYIKDSNRLAQMVLSKAELKKAYLDLRVVLEAIGLVEKSDDNFDSKLFRDANLFMPRSNGNDYLEFIEVVEYLHFVLAGIDAGKNFISMTDVNCRPDGKNLNINCFRRDFITYSPTALKHLPNYLLYSSKIKPEQWNKDIHNMELINRAQGATNDPIVNADVYETFVMLQYIEVIMLNYDLDRSGDLDIKEALCLLKLFKGIIGDILGINYEDNPDEVESFFTYILKYGDMPDPQDPLAQIKFNDWKWQKPQWSLRANRATLLKILALISNFKK